MTTRKKVANSKKASKDKLVQTLEFAKRTLIDTLQSELWNQIESAETKDKIREDTIRQLFQFLRENELPVPKSKDWAEPWRCYPHPGMEFEKTIWSHLNIKMSYSQSLKKPGTNCKSSLKLLIQ